MRSPLLEVRNLCKTFPGKNIPDVVALKEVSFSIREGDILTIIGPSGCGKSTLLNIIAGILGASTGDVIFLNEGLKPSRKVAYIFQQPRLIPWRNVLENVKFPLQLNKNRDRTWRRRDIAELADRYLSLVGLEGFGKRLVHEISGGMQQRVALSRGLAIEPMLLLMDEPFGSLDALTRGYLQAELLGIVEKTGKTVILVTHDIDEAVLLGDRTVVMTHAPGTIKEVIDIPFGHPRTMERVLAEKEYLTIRGKLLGLLREEPANAMGRRP